VPPRPGTLGRILQDRWLGSESLSAACAAHTFRGTTFAALAGTAFAASAFPAARTTRGGAADPGAVFVLRRKMAAAARVQVPAIHPLGSRLARGPVRTGGPVGLHASAKSRFLEALREAIQRHYGPNPQQSRDYGRSVNLRHFERLSGLLAGERVYWGGQRSAPERYFAPTLVDGVAEHSPLARDEVFGPILPAEAYDTEAELERLLARCRTPLVLYVFTEDAPAVASMSLLCPAGATVVNDTVSQVMNPRLPLGGVDTSGLGSYRGEESWRTFTRPKAVLVRSSRIDPGFRYPPYSPHGLAAMRRSLRPTKG
jgi:hypothetical protein